MQAIPTINILPVNCRLDIDEITQQYLIKIFEHKYFCLFARYQVRGATPQLVKSQKSKGK